MALSLFAELQAVVAALNEANVDHAICGALALAVHGAPRATTDIDLLVPHELIPKALDAVERVGFELRALPMTFADGMRVQRVTKIEAGDSVTLDLILVDDNLKEIWASRTRYESDIGPLSVISREALIQMKTWAGRTRDLADIERLQELDR